MTIRPPSLCAALLAVLAAAPASAQMGPTDSRLVPYAGHLDLDGVPVTGTYDFRFALFSSPTPNASCLGGTGCESQSLYWTEHAGVTVSNGAFSVSLGENRALNDSVLESEALYLAIAVRHGAEPFTVLGGTQRLLAVPFAARAAAAKDYRVSGNLQVGNDVAVAGGVAAGSLSSGSLEVGSTALVVDSATGRVGIGTATPAEDLEINGRVKAPGMWTYVASVTLAADANSITVTDIPAHYNLIKYFYKAATTHTGTTNFRVRFNNDTSATGHAWATASTGGGGQSSGVVGFLLPGSPARWAIGEGVGNADGSGHKYFAVTCVSHEPNVTYALHHGSLIWKSTAAVSSLSFFPDAGGLKAGSRVIVWGME